MLFKRLDPEEILEDKRFEAMFMSLSWMISRDFCLEMVETSPNPAKPPFRFIYAQSSIRSGHRFTSRAVFEAHEDKARFAAYPITTKVMVLNDNDLVAMLRRCNSEDRSVDEIREENRKSRKL